jgi:hypothetical protein
MNYEARMRFMKFHLALVATVLGTFAAGTTAVGITIDLSELSISGHWSEAWAALSGEGHNADGSFNSSRTDGQPLTFDYSSTHGFNSASCNLDPFSLKLNAYSVPRGLFADPGTGIGTSATVNTFFHVEGTKLAITVNAFSYWNYYSWEQDMGLTLQDVTSSVTLLNLQHLDEPGGAPFDEVYNLDVDPTHSYALTLSGWINAFDAKDARLSTQVYLQEAVPDYGSTLLLLGISVSTLFWAKKSLA